MKKFLLNDQACPYCDGYGALKAKHSMYRVRVRFPNDTWHFLDETYQSYDDAVWNVIEMKHGDADVEFEIVAPTGEIFSI
ncbi:MAG TPA: hypothetical protein VI423_02150 [Paenisporosarcina sp.]|nr:hypothetical protein [Paenisporosarcina sp.]